MQKMELIIIKINVEILFSLTLLLANFLISI